MFECGLTSFSSFCPEKMPLRFLSFLYRNEKWKCFNHNVHSHVLKTTHPHTYLWTCQTHFKESLIDDSITITILLQFCQQWISQYRPVQKYRVGVMKYLFINLSWLWRLIWQPLTDGPQWSEGEKIDNKYWIFKKVIMTIVHIYPFMDACINGWHFCNFQWVCFPSSHN